MTKKVTLDFETGSKCDITEEGAWKYSQHPSTRVYCLAYSIDEEPTKVWLPPKVAVQYIFNARAAHKGLIGHFSRVKGKPKRVTKKMLEEQRQRESVPFTWPEQFNSLVESSGIAKRGWNWDGDLVLPIWSKYKLKSKPDFLNLPLETLHFEAHNAFFEKSMWENVCEKEFSFPKISPEAWDCSAALSSYYALPRALDKVGAALELPIQKDLTGKLVMMQLARPKEDGSFEISHKKFTQLFEYCRDDVRAEKEIAKKLPPLSDYERRVWLLDQKINTRGVPLDAGLISGALQIIATYSKVLEEEMAKLTNGKLTNIRQIAALQLWLEENGILVDNVQKATVEGILSRENVKPEVRRVLEIRQALGQTSTAKYTALNNFLSQDLTAKDQFMYCGASTLRFSGKGAQWQNFPRGSLTPTEEMFKAIRSGSYRQLRLYGDVMDILSSCLRGCAAAPDGYVFMDSDFSNIEGRILAWVTGEEWKINAFKEFDEGIGVDLYILAYSKAFGIAPDLVNKDMRQIGKVMELALGYQGAVGAFAKMAAGYGVNLPEKEVVELVRLWRKAHPHVVAFWKAVEEAAMKAVLTGREISVNEKVSFVVEGDFLVCKTVAGSKMHYYKPLIQSVQTSWGDMRDALTFMGVNSVTKKFERQDTYGGKLTENIVQHLARVVLTDTMLDLDEFGFDIRLHIHDQIVSLAPENDPKLTIEAYDEIMSRPKEWAPDLPLAAVGEVLKRFKKG